jgi:hypothetical protein
MSLDDNGAKCAQLCKACEKAVYTIDRVAIDDEIYHSTRFNSDRTTAHLTTP